MHHNKDVCQVNVLFPAGRKTHELSFGSFHLIPSEQNSSCTALHPCGNYNGSMGVCVWYLLLP